MVTLKSIATALLAIASPAAAANKAVYAHFMVGIVEHYTVDDWKTDITQAQEIGIDGFALNCAPPRVDSYTPKQLANAYDAAAQLGFHVFISFDFAYWSNGDTAEITSILANYSSHPGQAYYNDGALVSTFVGDSFNWNAVKSSLAPQKLFAVPMLQDPNFLGTATTGLDGALSWYAWPTDGGNSVISGPMTTIWDDRYLANKGSRVYMAPVSPWFSTHFNTKNWVFICEEQPTIRWEQMLQMKPELIEILTWNDFGESHYISGSEPDHSDDGSSQWAAGFPHDAWRDLMKPYIAAYKSGAAAPTVTADEIVYWYRPTPKGVSCTADTLGVPIGVSLLADVVFVSTMLTSAADLTVTSGNQAPVTISAPAGIHTFNFTMGVGEQKFSVSRGGQTLFGGSGGLQIKNTCLTYNYNAYVGSFKASGGSNPPPTSTSKTTTSQVVTSSSSSSTTTSTTRATSTTSKATSTSTTSTSPPPATSSPGSGQQCTGGTNADGQSGNYIGLCNFACSYGYCPPGPCKCTSYGAPKTPPGSSGYDGCPLPNEDNSYLGLCSYCCSHGYCPDTACRRC